MLFLSAAVWLLVASVFGLIASIKFHAPGFLADSAWLTYGRVRPAGVNVMLYGFCLQAGLGVALWMLARLGRSALAAPWLVVVGAVCWNLGVVLGILGILRGGSTGFESLEMPGYAAALIFLGYLMMVVWGLLTFHRRRERQLYVTQWFLLAALFWFPWIYSTANLLLQGFRARGMAPVVVGWWYSDNLLGVWLGLVGLAAIFYFVPKLIGRDLHSRHLALLAFWMLILFGSCGGIPANAPVPAWMPAWSVVATVLGVVTVIAVFLNVFRTTGGKCLMLMSHPSLKFIGFGLVSFIVGGFASAVTALPAVNQFTQFTWFTIAKGVLNSYGYFAMVIFGAIYFIMPQVMGQEFPFPKLVRAHFFIAAAGVLMFVVPLALGGIVQGLKLQHADVPFTDIAKGTLPYLRASTLGDLLMALGHVMFLMNVAALVVQFYRGRAISAWAGATAEIKVAEARL
jgi:cytochrome c oxidase cbb3-type subunit I